MGDLPLAAVIKKTSPAVEQQYTVGILEQALSSAMKRNATCNININYQLGFRNMFDESFENVELFTQLVSWGVGYRF